MVVNKKTKIEGGSKKTQKMSADKVQQELEKATLFLNSSISKKSDEEVRKSLNLVKLPFVPFRQASERIERESSFESLNNESESLFSETSQTHLTTEEEVSAAIVQRFNYIKNMTFSQLYEVAQTQIYPKIQYKGEVMRIGVDAAPSNCGLSLMRVKTGEYVGIHVRSFMPAAADSTYTKKKEKEKQSISCQKLTDNWLLFIRALDCENLTWLIEDQVAAYYGTRLNVGVARMQDAMFNVLKGRIMPPERFFGISPSAVKSFFKNEYPDPKKEPEMSKGEYKELKYKTKKKNSEIFSKKLLKDAILEEFIRIYKCKHDISEAVVLTEFDKRKKSGCLSFSQQQKEDEKQEKRKKRVYRKKKKEEEPLSSSVLFSTGDSRFF